MLLGAHVSISGGISNAPQRGINIGCTAIQIFTKNQRQWITKNISTEELNNYKYELNNSPIHMVLAHDSYLINLASPDKNILEKSRLLFDIEMQRTEQLEIPYLIFHPGSHIEAGEKHGIHRIADSLNILLNKNKNHKVKLLLETTAGHGTSIGYRFEQLAEIIDLIEQRDRVGICFDTAHVFAAGYDIRTEDTYNKTLKEFNSILDINNLMAFHLNDSKKDLGSRVDRHEHIGKGLIGLNAFKYILNDSRFKNVPKILETPGNEADFKRNLDLLKSLTND